MEKQFFCAPNGKFSAKRTILTGFGFMATSIAWAIYDPYITKILNRLLSASATITAWSAKLNEAFPVLAKFAESQGENVTTAAGGITLVPLFIGIIMTFDNIFGVIFQPTFGKLSDRCHSKLGKRRPFIMFGAPISAALFAAITGGTFASFPGLVAAVPALNLPFFVGPVNGIVVSLVLYVILAKIMGEKAN